MIGLFNRLGCIAFRSDANTVDDRASSVKSTSDRWKDDLRSEGTQQSNAEVSLLACEEFGS